MHAISRAWRGCTVGAPDEPAVPARPAHRGARPALLPRHGVRAMRGLGCRAYRRLHRVSRRLDRPSLYPAGPPAPQHWPGAARTADAHPFGAAALGLSAQHGYDLVLSVARLSR